MSIIHPCRSDDHWELKIIYGTCWKCDKIAQIVKEELEELRKARFLKENPELYMAGAVTSSEPF